MLITQLEDPCKCDELVLLVQQQLNTSVSKTTKSTSFELLHGYMPRFPDGILRDLSTTSEEWRPPEELREAARINVFQAQGKIKDAYDLHRHDNIKFVPGEVIVMTRAPKHTGDCKTAGEIPRPVGGRRGSAWRRVSRGAVGT